MVPLLVELLAVVVLGGSCAAAAAGMTFGDFNEPLLYALAEGPYLHLTNKTISSIWSRWTLLFCSSLTHWVHRVVVVVLVVLASSSLWSSSGDEFRSSDGRCTVP